MIDRWEILADPHERFPGRVRINVAANEEDIQPLLRRFPDKTGKPWMPRKGAFRLAFYAYGLTPAEREAVERFLKGEKDVLGGAPPPAPPPMPKEGVPAFSWEDAAPDVEVISDARPSPQSADDRRRPGGPATPPKRREPEKNESLLQSPADALMDWAGSGPAAEPAPPSRPAPSFGEPAPRTALPDEPEEEAPSPRILGGDLVMSAGEMGMPSEELALSKDPEPDVPKGHIYVRLGYFFPEDISTGGDRIHALLVQTLESRRMPFVFHKVFTFPYRWPDRPLVDQVIEGCRKHKIDSLICVGERRRLELLLDRCAEQGIKAQFLSREDAQKKYWRLGLITRIVVTEED